MQPPSSGCELKLFAAALSVSEAVAAAFERL